MEDQPPPSPSSPREDSPMSLTVGSEGADHNDHADAIDLDAQEEEENDHGAPTHEEDGEEEEEEQPLPVHRPERRAAHDQDTEVVDLLDSDNEPDAAEGAAAIQQEEDEADEESEDEGQDHAPADEDDSPPPAIAHSREEDAMEIDRSDDERPDEEHEPEQEQGDSEERAAESESDEEPQQPPSTESSPQPEEKEDGTDDERADAEATIAPASEAIPTAESSEGIELGRQLADANARAVSEQVRAPEPPSTASFSVTTSASSILPPVALTSYPSFPSLPAASAAAAALPTADRLNLEQVFMQAEAQNAELRAANVKLQQSAQRTNGELALLHEKFESAQNELNTKKQELVRLDLALAERSQEVSRTKLDSNRLLQAQQAHVGELTKLRQSSQEYADQILTLNLEVSRLTHSVTQLDKQNVPLNFRIEQLEQEKQLLTQRQAHLETTLQTRSAELFTTRTQTGNQIVDLEAKAQQLQDANATLESQNEELRHQVKELTITIQKHLDTERDLSVGHASALGRLEHEIHTQTRLSNLYLQARDEARSEVASLQSSREQMQSSLTAALARQQELERTSQQAIDQLKGELATRDHQLQELTRTNADLTQQLTLLHEEMNASAHANGGSFSLVPNVPASPSARGSALALTHTQTTTTHSTSMQIGHAELYGKYLQALDQLRQERGESKLIEQYLQQIQREISEKAPLIEQQRFAYNKLIALNSTLADKVQQLQQEHAAIKHDHDQIKHARALDQAELDRARQECDDLARQVRSLLRGKSQIASHSDMSRLSAQALISESLIEVVDVDDVQKQNQRLVSVVRELSTQNEEFQLAKQREEIDLDAAVKAKQSEQLADAYQIIDTLKEQRKGLEVRLEALLHGVSLNANGDGGDTRMVLLDPQSLGTAAAGGLHGSSAATAGLVTDLQQQLRDRNTTFDHAKEDWQRDRAELQKSLADLQNQSEFVKKEQALTLRHQTQQLDSVHTQFSEARTQLAKVQSEHNSYLSLYAKLKTRHAEATREIETMRTRVDTLNSHLIGSQKQLQALEHERKQIDDAKQQLAVENVALQATAALASKASARSAEEIGDLRDQLSRMQSLLSGLQTMQTVFETRESTSRDVLIKEKETLRVDWVTCKQQLDEERRTSREMDRHHAVQLDDARAKLDAAQAVFHESKEQLVEAKTNLAATQQRVAQLESELAVAKESLDAIHSARQREREERESILAGDSAPRLTKEQSLELSLQQAKSECAEYLDTIGEQKVHLASLTELSQQTEKELQSLTLDSRMYRLRTDKELVDLRDTKHTLTARIEKLGSDLKQNEMENASQVDQLHQSMHKLESQLQQTEIQRKSSEKISSEYIANLERLQAEVQSHAQSALENQSRYESELTNHAATVQKLTSRREEAQAAEKELAALRAAHSSLQLELQAATATTARLQQEVSESTEAYEAKLAALKKQTDLLYSQIDVLTIQIARAQENQSIEGMLRAAPHQSGEEAATAGAAGEDSTAAKQLSDLRGIIKYLRSEKDEIHIQHERLVQLHARSEHQVSQQKHELQEVQAQLQAEIRRHATGATAAASSASSTTAAEHERLLAQLNQLHVLQESNSMLREESNKQVAKLQQLQSTIDRLSASVTPLQQRIDELEATKSALESDLAATRLENSRWSGRYQKLLAQSDFIDPEIHALLQQEHESLQKRLAAIEGDLATLQEAHLKVEADRDQLQVDRDQVQARFEKMKSAASHWKVKFESASKEEATLRVQVTELQQQSAAEQSISEITQAKNQAESRLTRVASGLSNARRVMTVHSAQLTALRASHHPTAGDDALQHKIDQLAQEKATLQKESDLRISSLQQELAAQSRRLESSRASLEAELQSVRGALEVRTKEVADTKAAVQTLKTKLATQIAQARQHQANVTTTAPTALPPADATHPTAAALNPDARSFTPSSAVQAPPTVAGSVAVAAPAQASSLKRKLVDEEPESAAKRPAASPASSTAAGANKPVLKRPPPAAAATIPAEASTTAPTPPLDQATSALPPAGSSDSPMATTDTAVDTSSVVPPVDTDMATRPSEEETPAESAVLASPPAAAPFALAVSPTTSTAASVATATMPASPFGGLGGASGLHSSGFGTYTAFGGLSSPAAFGSNATNFFGSSAAPSTSVFGSSSTAATPAPTFGSQSAFGGSGFGAFNSGSASAFGDSSASTFGGSVFGAFTAAGFGSQQTLNTTVFGAPANTAFGGFASTAPAHSAEDAATIKAADAAPASTPLATADTTDAAPSAECAAGESPEGAMEDESAAGQEGNHEAEGEGEYSEDAEEGEYAEAGEGVEEDEGDYAQDQEEDEHQGEGEYVVEEGHVEEEVDAEAGEEMETTEAQDELGEEVGEEQEDDYAEGEGEEPAEEPADE